MEVNLTLRNHMFDYPMPLLKKIGFIEDYECLQYSDGREYIERDLYTYRGSPMVELDPDAFRDLVLSVDSIKLFVNRDGIIAELEVE